MARPCYSYVIVQQRTTRNHQGKRTTRPCVASDQEPSQTGTPSPTQHTRWTVFLQEHCDGSSDVIGWSRFLPAPMHLSHNIFYMFLTTALKWHTPGVISAGTLIGKVGTHVCSSIKNMIPFQEILRKKYPFFGMKSRNFNSLKQPFF